MKTDRSIPRAATFPIPTFLILTALIATAPVVAQSQSEPQEPAARFGEKIEVIEVLLDVLATDKKGNVVPGLGVDDFVVIENGERIEPTSVNFYTTRYADEKSGTGVEELPASRFFIFFFHDQQRAAVSVGRLLQQQLEAGRESHEWVRDHMLPSDWIAVAGYDSRLILYQDFTQDRDSILYAIEQATLGKDPGVRKPSERKRLERDAFSLWRHLPEEIELGKQTTRPYDALRLLAEATGSIVGRKNLLLFSIGFGRIDRSGPYARPDERYYPALERALNANNVAIYPLDLAPTGVEHFQTSFLNQLASDSGGRYFQNFVSFATPLRQISDETAGYYLLSYRTEVPAGEEGYRDVKVKTRAKKVQIRARRGFRYGGDDSTVATPGS